MNKKYIIIGIIVLVLGIGVYYFLNDSDQQIANEVVNDSVEGGTNKPLVDDARQVLLIKMDKKYRVLKTTHGTKASEIVRHYIHKIYDTPTWIDGVIVRAGQQNQNVVQRVIQEAISIAKQYGHITNK